MLFISPDYRSGKLFGAYSHKVKHDLTLWFAPVALYTADSDKIFWDLEGVCMQRIAAHVLTVAQETPDVRRLTFAVEEPLDYLPGQWIDLYATLAGREEVGGYSLTTAPEPINHTFELAIRRAAHGHAVTDYLYAQAQPGDRVMVVGGQGDCVWQPQMGLEVVLIAGGIGITPLLSIFRSVRDQAPDARATLLYSATQADGFAFETEIRTAVAADNRLQAHFTLTGETPPDWTGLQGHIEADWILRLGLNPNALYYLCGPRPMIYALAESLPRVGVAPERIFYERW
jgi:ferredoxin-NADP reductase